MRVRVPGADKEAVKGLVRPDLPNVVEAKGLGPVSDHAPAVEEDDRYGYRVEHCLRANSEVALRPPVDVDADCLGKDADDEQIG